MRIISGRWAGVALTSPSGRVRPTAESLRDRCMGLVAGDLPGARVVDLFAGTGALGLEALSRGAQSVDLVENGAAALHALKANVAALRARGRTRIFKRDAIVFAEGLEAGVYDVAFADPPYGGTMADRVVRHWLAVPFSRLMVVEHAEGHVLPGHPRHYPEGGSSLSVYRVR